MWRSPVLIVALALSIAGMPVNAQRPIRYPPNTNHREGTAVEAITAVLSAQVAAWNRGDIEAFMEGYWRSAETIFISGDNVTRGWQTVLDRYKKNYDSREKMGTLVFSDLEIKLISKDTAIAIGRWRLQQVKDEPHGRFTLILRRIKKEWRIVHDHTSSA